MFFFSLLPTVQQLKHLIEYYSVNIQELISECYRNEIFFKRVINAPIQLISYSIMVKILSYNIY